MPRIGGNSGPTKSQNTETLSANSDAQVVTGHKDLNLSLNRNDISTVVSPDGMIRNRDIKSSGFCRSELINLAKKAPVPQRVQLGPTCGLYALGMVMDAWHKKDPSNKTALVTAQDKSGLGEQYTQEPNDDRFIMDVAKQQGYTAVGEMFTAEGIASTARQFGYQAKTHHECSLDDLYKVIDAGHPAIVAFDVDYNGNPVSEGGARAHYAIIQGYLDDNGERYLVARHGWGVQKDHVWLANKFAESWKGLESTDFYGVPGDDLIPSFPGVSEPEKMPKSDLGNGKVSIKESLSAKIVEVIPQGKSFAELSHA